MAKDRADCSKQLLFARPMHINVQLEYNEGSELFIDRIFKMTDMFDVPFKKNRITAETIKAEGTIFLLNSEYPWCSKLIAFNPDDGSSERINLPL